MSNRIIAISREFAAAAEPSARNWLQSWEFPAITETLEKIAEQSGFTKDYIAEHGEYATGVNCLRVFIHADMESRAKRIVEQYGERTESPEKRQ